MHRLDRRVPNLRPSLSPALSNSPRPNTHHLQLTAAWQAKPEGEGETKSNALASHLGTGDETETQRGPQVGQGPTSFAEPKEPELEKTAVEAEQGTLNEQEHAMLPPTLTEQQHAMLPPTLTEQQHAMLGDAMMDAMLLGDAMVPGGAKLDAILDALLLDEINEMLSGAMLDAELNAMLDAMLDKALDEILDEMPDPM